MVKQRVSVYVRDVSPDCKAKHNGKYRSEIKGTCSCWKWLYFHSTRKRARAKLKSWDEAEALAGSYEKASDPETVKAGSKSIAQAVDDYLSTLSGGSEWLDKNNRWLKERLVAWCGQQMISEFHQLTSDKVIRFLGENSWPRKKRDDKCAPKKELAPLKVNQGTKARVREMLSSFFIEAIERGWSNTNPCASKTVSKKYKMPKPMPEFFTPEQYERILDASCLFASSQVPAVRDRSVKRLRVMIVLLRWSGLRISDASTLRRDELVRDKDGSYYIDRLTIKSQFKIRVEVPVHDFVAEELLSLPIEGDGAYFFLSSKPEGDRYWETSSKDWTDKISDFCSTVVGVKGHPHMFRHTFAIELLKSGTVTMEDLQSLLGHASYATTMKHYNAFDKRRSRAIADRVRSTWRKGPALVKRKRAS